MAACIVCKEDIKAGAKICTHCKSYQDWRRFFGSSQMVLSLLIALFSVLTVAVPVISRTLAVKNSDISIHLVSAVPSNASVIAGNDGVRAGTVVSGQIMFEKFAYPAEPIEGATILAPEELKLINFETGIATKNYLQALSVVSNATGHPNKESNCIFSIKTRDFRGSENDHTFRLKCTEFLFD